MRSRLACWSLTDMPEKSTFDGIEQEAYSNVMWSFMYEQRTMSYGEVEHLFSKLRDGLESDYPADAVRACTPEWFMKLINEKKDELSSKLGAFIYEVRVGDEIFWTYILNDPKDKDLTKELPQEASILLREIVEQCCLTPVLFEAKRPKNLEKLMSLDYLMTVKPLRGFSEAEFIRPGVLFYVPHFPAINPELSSHLRCQQKGCQNPDDILFDKAWRCDCADPVDDLNIAACNVNLLPNKEMPSLRHWECVLARSKLSQNIPEGSRDLTCHACGGLYRPFLDFGAYRRATVGRRSAEAPSVKGNPNASQNSQQAEQVRAAPAPPSTSPAVAASSVKTVKPEPREAVIIAKEEPRPVQVMPQFQWNGEVIDIDDDDDVVM